MRPDAFNYNARANKDDSGCIDKVHGCVYNYSKNYNESLGANTCVNNARLASTRVGGGSRVWVCV